MAEAEKEDEGMPIFTEAVEGSWRDYLKDFVDEVYPVFARDPYNFTIPQAMTAWETNRLKNVMLECRDLLQQLVDK